MDTLESPAANAIRFRDHLLLGVLGDVTRMKRGGSAIRSV
jgi:hypothetical protein